MKRLETFTGGHPFSATDFTWMQDGAKEILGLLARMFLPVGAGPCILEGCAVSSDPGVNVTIQPGYIYYDGEVYRVPGKTVSAASIAGCSLAVLALEPGTAENPQVTYANGINRAVYQERVLDLLGNTSGVFLLNGLSRANNFDQPGTVKIVWFPNVSDFEAQFDTTTGIGKNQYQGWAWLNGAGGRPDWRGRIPVGFNPSDSDFDAFTKTGGAKTHTLTVDEMPGHTHNINSEAGTGSPFIISAGDGAGSGLTSSTTSTGGGQPHNNMPPYSVGAYIIKL